MLRWAKKVLGMILRFIPARLSGKLYRGGWLPGSVLPHPNCKGGLRLFSFEDASSKRPRSRRYASGFPVESLRVVDASNTPLVGQPPQLIGQHCIFYHNSALPIHAGIAPWAEIR